MNLTMPWCFCVPNLVRIYQIFLQMLSGNHLSCAVTLNDSVSPEMPTCVRKDLQSVYPKICSFQQKSVVYQILHNVGTKCLAGADIADYLYSASFQENKLSHSIHFNDNHTTYDIKPVSLQFNKKAIKYFSPPNKYYTQKEQIKFTMSTEGSCFKLQAVLSEEDLVTHSPL